MSVIGGDRSVEQAPSEARTLKVAHDLAVATSQAGCPLAARIQD